MKNTEIVAAILAGSSILGAALYLGLRASRPEAVAAPLVGTAAAAAVRPSSATVPPPMTAPALTAPPTDPKALEAAVTRALDTLKPALVSECLAPSVARQKEPRQVKYTWNGTIGPGGVPLSSGLIEDRAASRPDMTPCVQRRLLRLRLLPGSGQGFVESSFTLP